MAASITLAGPLSALTLSTASEGGPTLDDYLGFAETAGITVVASVIGPTAPAEDGSGCNPASSGLGPPYCCNNNGSPYRRIRTYEELAAKTGGVYVPICDTDDGYDPNPDFATALEDIGALISRLQNRFELEYAPDPTSIQVMVSKQLIAEDAENGWAYFRQGEKHYVEFRGEAVPGYEALVEIYYRPQIAGDPRTLPF